MRDPFRVANAGALPMKDRAPGMWTEEEQSQLVRGLQEFASLGHPTNSTTQYLHLALHTFPGQRTVREMIQRVQAIQAAMSIYGNNNKASILLLQAIQAAMKGVLASQQASQQAVHTTGI